jgi:hypothetical protein
MLFLPHSVSNLLAGFHVHVLRPNNFPESGFGIVSGLDHPGESNDKGVYRYLCGETFLQAEICPEMIFAWPVSRDLSGLASGEATLSSDMSSRKPESLLAAPQ